jgi:hypothetical protein
VELEIAARLKCPIHGDRSRTWCFLYSPKWHREREKIRRGGLSPQFQKAWLASFPANLWPAEEEETADGIYLRLKDGTGWWERSSVGERTETSVSPGDFGLGKAGHMRGRRVGLRANVSCYMSLKKILG